MADTACGRCGRLAYMEPASGLHLTPNGDQSLFEAVYKCPKCKRLNLASEYKWHAASEPMTLGATNAGDFEWADPDWIPRLGEKQEFPDVPSHIADAASEATLCLSLGADRAVGSLARAVVEATAKDKQAAGGNLAARIDSLRADGHIREHTKEQAHEIRHFGNDMAHGDFADPVTPEEAAEIIGLMSEILNEVYQSPARVARVRSARENKKSATS